MFKKLFNQLMGNDENAGNNTNPQSREQQAATEPVRNQPRPTGSYDPQTQHGTHYTETDFDAEVSRRAEAWIADEIADGETIDEREKQNIYHNYRQQVYLEWNECDTDQYIMFQHANSMKYMGVQASGFVKTDEGNPLLEPVHGVSLKDYAAMCIKIGAGVDAAVVCKAMGLEPVIWDELNTIWPQRMAEDSSFTITTLFGQYFADNEAHPKLQGLQAPAAGNAGGATDNLERLKNDRYFYEELCGARQAAYEYGLDGAQWILDNYGINLADFQSVAMQHMTAQNQDFNSERIHHFMDYQQEKQKEYAAKFAAEQGGNIADDVEF